MRRRRERDGAVETGEIGKKKGKMRENEGKKIKRGNRKELGKTGEGSWGGKWGEKGENVGKFVRENGVECERRSMRGKI